MEDTLWWLDGIVYQIYPRSFADSNGDGLGDLPGILSKLDYLAALGVDAIWLSPFYPSPDRDFGYDVSDYCDVDARFGSLADFDRLVAGIHQRGMHIILDMVMNHSSDQHAWFQGSRLGLNHPLRDWYIWRPPRRRGKSLKTGVPNNWQACFGGKAWTFDPLTGEYYLHLFTPGQPDFNWRNPQVRQALLDVFRFWLERGVDGFRLDVFNAYFKDAELRDNPTKFGLRAFDRQEHIHDMDQPEMHPLLQELRRLLDSHPGRYSVGETYLATLPKTLSYCGSDKLHAAFSFDFTSYDSALAYALHRFPWNPAWILEKVAAREAAFEKAGVFPTTVLSNHDLPRAATRYIRSEDDRMAKVIMAVLLTLRGTPFLYQGEEIGMRDVPLKRNELQDPLGRKYYPLIAGRDGCRSPMQWNDSAQAGFTTGKPWLKVHPNYHQRNVAAQERQPDSMLQFTRALIALRRLRPSLQRGDFTPLPAHRHVLAFLRRSGAETTLVAMNFSSTRQNLPLPASHRLVRCLFSSQPELTPCEEHQVELAPFEVSLFDAEAG